MASSEDFFSHGFVVTVKENERGVTVEAREVSTENQFVLTIDSSKLPALTNHACSSARVLQGALKLAAQNADNRALTLEVVRPGPEAVQTDDEGHSPAFFLRISYRHTELSGEVRSFDLQLPGKHTDLSDRVESLSRALVHRKASYSDRFTEAHADMRIFLNGLGVGIFRNSGVHRSARVGEVITSGTHTYAFRIIRCVNSFCMIGLLPADVSDLTTYPGSSSLPRGLSLYGHDGSIYHSGAYEGYGLGGFGPGDYVFIKVDLRARTVTWSINAKEGAARSLTGTSYYVVANLYSDGDAIEIIPEYCTHF